MGVISVVLATIYIGAPAWIANAGTAIFWHFFIIRWKVVPRWPIDGNLRVHGRRLFGDGRTIFGSLFMVLCATLVGYLQGNLLLGAVMGLSTLAGTLADSFLKRRLRVPEGTTFLLDHIDYAMVVVVVLWIFQLVPPGFNPLFFVFWVFVFQFSVNAIARQTGFRTSPTPPTA